ncbi:MAG: cyanophycin synthetase [Pseudomonadota bacterium]
MSRLDEELHRRWGLGIHPGLERIRGVLDRLDTVRNPALRILIAGTNGKGSTATFLEAILRAHGCHTGLFTSPHLIDAVERIRLDGAIAGDEALGPAWLAVSEAEAATGIGLTGFEWITAVAAAVFDAAAVPCWILEVGLGGRLDATNAMDPDLSIITPVGLDHTEILGDDLGSIAREKAGILRAGRPALLAAQTPEAGRALEAAAAASGAEPVLRAFVDWRWTLEADHLRWEGPDGLSVGPVALGMRGAHQGGNAALALAAAAHVLPTLTGAALVPAYAARGVATAHLAGRLQPVSVRGRRVLLDVAHNPHGIEALAASYRARWGRCPAALVALKDDKDAAGVMGPLAAMTSRLIVCPLPKASGHTPEALARACPGPGAVEIAGSWQEGLEGLPAVPPEAPPPLIIGSHYLVGAVLGIAD